MERSTFFRPSDDMDFMAPLSDVSDDEVFASAPRMAARSIALAAKKRGPVTCHTFLGVISGHNGHKS